MSVICRKFLLKLALEDEDVSKPQQVLCLYGPMKSKPRLKSELRKQQYTVTLFDRNHLAHVIVLWQMQKFMCYSTVFALFYFELEGNFRVQVPGGLYLKGRFIGGFFWRYEFGGGGGAYIWRSLFSNFTVVSKPCHHNHSNKMTKQK